jgi:hypothetical protein
MRRPKRREIRKIPAPMPMARGSWRDEEAEARVGMRLLLFQILALSPWFGLGNGENDEVLIEASRKIPDRYRLGARG